VSWHSATHELVSLLVFLALVAAPLVLARAFSGCAPWRDLRAYSITTGVVGLVLLVLLFSDIAGSWTGVVQRGARDRAAAMDRDSRRAANPTLPRPATRARALNPSGGVGGHAPISPSALSLMITFGCACTG
jgi:hypothetical protein